MTGRVSRKLLILVMVMVLVGSNFAGGALTPLQSLTAYGLETEEQIANEAQLDEQLEFLKKIVIFVEKNYVDEITYEELMEEAYDGVFEALDPYSDYFKEENYEKFVENATGEFSGIGVLLTTRDEKCTIISPLEDSPAIKAGIKAGDVIVQVDDLDVRKMSTAQIADLTRGAENTPVRLGIERAGVPEIIYFDLIRKKIQLKSVTGEIINENIAYIKILQFDTDTGEEFKEKLKELENLGARSLIIDIRNNPGGVINAAVDIAEVIMPEGPVTHLQTKNGELKTYSSETPGIGIPVAVLLNGGSASASELLAGALQDSDAATLIGTQSFGKGSAQRILPLKNGAGLKLTIARYLTPDERNIDHVGLTPDFVVENEMKAAEELVAEVKTFAPMVEDRKPGLDEKSLNIYGAQQRLKFLGYQGVETTGICDALTFDAIKRFQASEGLYAYGVLDYTTRSRLIDAVNARIESNVEDAQLQKAIETVKLGG